MSVIFTCNFLTDGQNVLRLVDALGGDLGDVDQAVNARDDLSEGAEGGDRNDLQPSTTSPTW